MISEESHGFAAGRDLKLCIVLSLTMIQDVYHLLQFNDTVVICIFVVNVVKLHLTATKN